MRRFVEKNDARIKNRRDENERRSGLELKLGPLSKEEAELSLAFLNYKLNLGNLTDLRLFKRVDFRKSGKISNFAV